MRFECWITKAADTHSEYAILITFPQQQWLQERASVLHYTYIVLFVSIVVCLCMIPFANFEDDSTGMWVSLVHNSSFPE